MTAIATVDDWKAFEHLVKDFVNENVFVIEARMTRAKKIFHQSQALDRSNNRRSGNHQSLARVRRTSSYTKAARKRLKLHRRLLLSVP